VIEMAPGDTTVGSTPNVLALTHTRPACVADDPRFATAVYRAAIDQGVMSDVVFE
jgi:hypothetical protein